MMLDPKAVQVLFADLQPQMVARSKTNPPDALARSVAVLAQVARLLHLPMHLSVVPEGGQRPELIPELAREMDGVARLPRISFSPFFDEATRAAIAETRRPHLVIAGFATEAVVVHGVCDAIAAGYRVYLPVDACGGIRTLRGHETAAPLKHRRRGHTAARAPNTPRSRDRGPIEATNGGFDSFTVTALRGHETAAPLKRGGLTLKQCVGIHSAVTRPRPH